ncbi:hypothetical protein [Hirschia baltica]|uniref:Uncharacterized protein n=1 Tax=Hirschia baltica (strain ATCC 49814 / DSM 5838 / IFAM 1418) TaxID=582402 RepID=C6XJN3_HIRBI|nr:hypothetical protein [Hirschia baltica]ACT59328.1 hypothetical protein Hbal_1640 [Hirschia baltica ATCC 49814]
MTTYPTCRRCTRSAAQDRLAFKQSVRRFDRYWRRPNNLSAWTDLPLLTNIGPISRCKIEPPSLAERHVQHLTGLPPSTSRLIAELAGFHVERQS